jgi:hypothetical protein|tara:strand:+ start:719 stop:820 length:102 start_codon:yes stop_codon:yes gene_type:complete
MKEEDVRNDNIQNMHITNVETYLMIPIDGTPVT